MNLPRVPAVRLLQPCQASDAAQHTHSRPGPFWVEGQGTLIRFLTHVFSQGRPFPQNPVEVLLLCKRRGETPPTLVSQGAHSLPVSKA